MVNPQGEGHRRSSGARVEIQNAFDIRAKCRLELELRLDRFNDALGARGGRVLSVARGRVSSGGYFAAVRYSFPLPRESSRPDQRESAPARVRTRGGGARA